jgi:hypothetical protein
MDKQETLRFKRLHTGDKVELGIPRSPPKSPPKSQKEKEKEKEKELLDEREKKDKDEVFGDENYPIGIPRITDNKLLKSIKDWIKEKPTHDNVFKRKATLRGIRNAYQDNRLKEQLMTNVFNTVTRTYKEDPFNTSTSEIIEVLHTVDKTRYESLYQTGAAIQSIGTLGDRFDTALQTNIVDMNIVDRALAKFLRTPSQSDYDDYTITKKIKAYRDYRKSTKNNPSTLTDLRTIVGKILKSKKEEIEKLMEKITGLETTAVDLEEEAKMLSKQIDRADPTNDLENTRKIASLNDRIRELRTQQDTLRKTHEKLATEYTDIPEDVRSEFRPAPTNVITMGRARFFRETPNASSSDGVLGSSISQNASSSGDAPSKKGRKRPPPLTTITTTIAPAA